MEILRKIAVLGTGPSLKEFNPSAPSEFIFCIGVNDIWRFVKCEAVVCLDNPNAFTPDRLKVINECEPKVFYSQNVIWDTRRDFRKIDLLPGYPDVFCQLETPAFHKSYCSPFVACQIAYRYYYADEIHLFGVDMVNHPHLDAKICAKIKLHFKNLKVALLDKNCPLIIHGQGILKDI